MKRNAGMFSLFVVVFLFSAAYASAQAPLPVSPGARDDSALVISGCPTFSWSEAEDAVSYRVAVFETRQAEGGLTYEETLFSKAPVLEQIIPDRGLAWTPSANRCLPGGQYVWYVAAISAEDIIEWSEGKKFTVDALAPVDADSRAGVGEKTILRTEKPAGTGTGAKAALSLEQVLSSAVVREQPVPPGDLQGLPVIAPGEEGESNTVYGHLAGNSLSDDRSATFVGVKAGYANTTGDHNTFIGWNAGYSNDEGGNNTFVGSYVGYSNTSGKHNTFIGYGSAYKNTTGHANTFAGMNAGSKNTSGYDNTFIGQGAGYENTTGEANTYVGNSAGTYNKTGFFNTFIGTRAGFRNSEGKSNVFVGRASGYNHENGDFNTFIGRDSGYNNVDGRHNIFIGHGAGYNEEGSHKLYIASSDTATPLIYGEFDNHIVKIHGELQMTASIEPSDIRLKTDIRPLKSSLERVLSLQGVSYRWKTAEYPEWGFKDTRQVGLLAQDVEAVIPELVSTDSHGYKALSYDKLTAVLVEAVKELKAENEALRMQNENLKARLDKKIDHQQSQIDEMRALIEELRG